MRSPLGSVPIVVRVQSVSPLTTMPDPPPSRTDRGAGGSAGQDGCARQGNHAESEAADAMICKAVLRRTKRARPISAAAPV